MTKYNQIYLVYNLITGIEVAKKQCCFTHALQNEEILNNKSNNAFIFIGDLNKCKNLIPIIINLAFSTAEYFTDSNGTIIPSLNDQ